MYICGSNRQQDTTIFYNKMAMKSHIRSTVLLVILIVGYIHIVQLIVYYSNYFDRITARHFGRNEDNQTRTAIEVGTSNEQRQGQQDQEQTSSHTSSSSPPSSPPSSSSCQRYCPQKINKIVFTDKPTGISDRKGILHGLAQLSAYLCAQLVVPPPNELCSGWIQCTCPYHFHDVVGTHQIHSQWSCRPSQLAPCHIHQWCHETRF